MQLIEVMSSQTRLAWIPRLLRSQSYWRARHIRSYWRARYGTELADAYLFWTPLVLIGIYVGHDVYTQRKLFAKSWKEL